MNKKNNKDTNYDIPRNINNYRQIINANPNIGNLNWVYKLRDSNLLTKNIAASRANPFNCFYKQTETFSNKIKKENLFQPKVNNKTSHLLKRRPGGTISQTQLNFETNLRSIDKSNKNNKKIKKININKVDNLFFKYYSKNSLSRIPIKIKDEIKIKKDIYLKLKEIENINDVKEKIRLIKNLPKLEKIYEQNNKKKEINIQAKINNVTSHLIKKRPDGNASQTQLKFETNLRNLTENKNLPHETNISEKLYNTYVSNNLLKGLPLKVKDEIKVKKEIKQELKEIEKISDFKERLNRIKKLPKIKKND